MVASSFERRHVKTYSCVKWWHVNAKRDKLLQTPSTNSQSKSGFVGWTEDGFTSRRAKASHLGGAAETTQGLFWGGIWGNIMHCYSGKAGIYVHSIWLTPASFGSRHDLTLVVRSQTKRQQSAHSTKDQGLHSCHN